MNKEQAEAKYGKVSDCPCCGDSLLSVGNISSSVLGVTCLNCGLEISRDTPGYYDESIMGMSYKDFTLRLAIMAWNRRPNE